MTTRHFLAAIVVLTSPPLTAQQSLFRSGADAVLVDVSVRNGRQIVAGLGASDFALTDNRVSQVITDASVESLPVDLTILLDASGSASAIFGNSLQTAAARFRALMKPEDRLDVRLFGARLIDAAAWDGRPLGSWAIGRAAGLNDGGTAFFDTLIGSLVRPALPGHRRLIIALTDGVDTSSFTSEATRLALIDRADAVVHIVAFSFRQGGFSSTTSSGGVSTVSPIGARIGAPMQAIADRSGGRFINLDQTRSFVDTLAAAIAEFRTRYLLRYVPRGVDAGGWHEINVTVKGKDYEIKARKGYQRGDVVEHPEP